MRLALPSLAVLVLPSFAALVFTLAECAVAPGAADADAGSAVDAALPFLDTGASFDAGPIVIEASAPSCILPPSGLTSDESCSACLQASCCTAITTCFDNPACVGINACLTACFSGVAPEGGLTTCEEQCHPAATGATETAIEAELACFTGACASACPGPPLCGTPTGSFLQTCNACQLVGGTLTCDCVNSAGGTNVSAVDLCGCVQPPAIANTNGALSCASSDGG